MKQDFSTDREAAKNATPETALQYLYELYEQLIEYEEENQQRFQDDDEDDYGYDDDDDNEIDYTQLALDIKGNFPSMWRLAVNHKEIQELANWSPNDRALNKAFAQWMENKYNE